MIVLVFEVSKTSISQAITYLQQKKIKNINCKLWKPDTKIPFQNKKKFKLIFWTSMYLLQFEII